MTQASVRALAIGAGIDLGRKYKDQSITKLSKLMLVVSERLKVLLLANVNQAKEAEPYLARFEDDWATGQILRQYINGKHKYETAKAKGKVKIGEKRKCTSPASPNKRIKRRPSGGEDDVPEMSLNSSDSKDNTEYEDYEDDWTGIEREESHTDGSLEFCGSDDNDRDGSETP